MTPQTISDIEAAGLLWVYRFTKDGAAEAVACEQVAAALADHAGWTWIHLGLADARGREWVAHQAPLSETARDILIGADEHLRLDILGSEILGVVPDLQRDLAQPTEELVRLRFVMTERMLITARRTPAHSVEVTRRAVEAGRKFPTAISFLDTVIDQFADAVGRMTESVGEELDALELHVLHRELGNERERLGRVRLQTARVHRQLAQLRGLFHRLEPRLAQDNAPVALAVRALAQKLDALDHEAAALHDRARLLLDEVAAKVSDIANRRLLTLSLLTACLLPPTLVTGFFGMNTKDLPLQQTDGGSWIALLVALGAGAFSYWAMARLRAL
jgi:zinc transporter